MQLEMWWNIDTISLYAGMRRDWVNIIELLSFTCEPVELTISTWAEFKSDSEVFC